MKKSSLSLHRWKYRILQRVFDIRSYICFIVLKSIGETIRKALQSKNMTQEELGVLIGVRKAQISRLERGYNNMTLTTVSRVFRALGITSAYLDLSGIGKVALW